MTKKLTQEEINQRLSVKKITLISEYINSTKSVTVQCEKGHIWTTRVANIFNRGDGCPHCSGHSSVKRYTVSELEKIFKDRNVTFITKYKDIVPTSSKATFICDDGHTWATSVNSMLGKKTNGCGVCYGNTPLNLDILQKRYEKYGYKIISTYVNSNEKIQLECSEGHIWWGAPLNTKCSSCASYGFKLSKTAFGYILVFDNFIKYGISNSIESRLHRHKIHNPSHTVHLIHKFDDGNEAKKWEKMISEKFGKKFVDKSKCPDGWTETTHINNLEEITKSLRYWKI